MVLSVTCPVVLALGVPHLVVTYGGNQREEVIAQEPIPRDLEHPAAPPLLVRSFANVLGLVPIVNRVRANEVPI